MIFIHESQINLTKVSTQNFVSTQNEKRKFKTNKKGKCSPTYYKEHLALIMLTLIIIHFNTAIAVYKM